MKIFLALRYPYISPAVVTATSSDPEELYELLNMFPGRYIR